MRTDDEVSGPPGFVSCGKVHLIGNSRGPASLSIGEPAFGIYSSRSINPRPRGEAYAANTPTWGILNPARGARVLVAHTRRFRPFLDELGLIDDQHTPLAQRLRDHRPHVITDPVDVPGGGVPIVLL